MPNKTTQGDPPERDSISPDPLALVEELLTRLEISTDPARIDGDGFLDHLVRTLAQLVIDERGGDSVSRELRAAVYGRLEYVLGPKGLDAAALMLIAKILSDSGWSVPERLKKRVVEKLDATEPTANVGYDLRATLAEIAEASEGDPFAAYDSLNSVLAAFPPDAAAPMVGALGEGRAPVLTQVLAGFAMHREPALAKAAIEALKRKAKSDRVQSSLIERLVRMRPWLSSDRQPALDEAIRALRVNALPPTEADRPKLASAFVMACDGSGAGVALANLKARDGWRFVAATTKSDGIEEALSLEGLSKREADMTVRGMRETVTTAQTDAQGLAGYLELALGENVVAGAPPPFRFIALAEAVGFGPLAPRPISPADLAAQLLADWPDSGTNSATAQQTAFEFALDMPWFETGEAVERLLAPKRGAKARARAMLADYLPARRQFWTRVCALTAFVLDLEPKPYGVAARALALVARELASGEPLERIPLMQLVAERTVAVYAARALNARRNA